MMQIAALLSAVLFASSLGQEMNPKFKVLSGVNPNPAFYEQNTKGLYFGDIKLTPEQKQILLNGTNSEDTSLQKRKFYKAQKRWPGGNVYYEPLSIGSFKNAPNYQKAIREAIQHIEAKTCIRFFASASAPNRIRFVYKTGCNSPLGMVGGVQEIHLGQNCDHTGVVIHEICHSLGFMHEQNRPDRDNYVTINWSNIPQQWVHAFTMHPWSKSNTLGIPYDFSSIMQYEPKAFARNRNYYTIIPKRNQAQNLKLMGQMKGLAPNDIKAIHIVYQNCGGRKPKGGSGQTGPCVDGNNQCAGWAKLGECKKNAAYMLKNCRKSCGQCSGGVAKPNCVDKNASCSGWAKSGECSKNAAYMLPNCPRSCGRC